MINRSFTPNCESVMTGSFRSTLRPRVPVLWAFFIYAFAVRVLPYFLHETAGTPLKNAVLNYPWHFTPLFALALFGGAAFSVRLAILAPLATMVFGDLLIAALSGGQWGFYRDQPFTYLGFLLIAACGIPIRRRRHAGGIALAGLGGATAFFFISNFGVWITGGGYVRPLTPSGLLMCYADGLPFYGPTVLSMAVFLPLLFSPIALRREVKAFEGTTA